MMRLSNEYINRLKNSLFKILCLFEEQNEGLSQYIDSLQYELYGLVYMIPTDQVSSIESIMATLEHFYDDSYEPEPNLKVIRREVFRCLDLVKKTFEDGDE